ncbi:pyridoxal-phosphate dependent enzyme [Frigidibacter sp. ROC022]|uniref:pyridoxal-phosphate dependent enzyme n=1 Tax=Frigidibacter sp. ROC022 TaxID=2971796 RepID=UPI00215A700F|nr:pyridoxal-phosphate dependent enzyme [Frigidibacter sp. ROC022]MCR8725508.1 pyridoxal-phosphate dependent enzyme [Frigidibacter sp. ROC022]
MEYLSNPCRGRGLSHPDLAEVPWPLADPSAARALYAQCPKAAETPLTGAPGLATEAGIGTLLVKDERGRMGLGSFKALGAAHVIARDAAEGRARGSTYVTASAGNHGLSVAAGAAAFGARARIYLAETVPESFAARLQDAGAEVRRAGASYEDSMQAALQAARTEGLELLSDSSWPGYTSRPLVLMEGYLILFAELAAQIGPPPTHVVVQAGVGGLAGAAAAFMRAVWGDGPRIVVVEPAAAPALQASIRAAGPVTAPGPVSIMGRLDCKEPSLIALKGLARDADAFVTITEDEAAHGTRRAEANGLASTPSGAAGIAALLAAGPEERAALELDARSRVLAILTEAPTP